MLELIQSILSILSLISTLLISIKIFRDKK